MGRLLASRGIQSRQIWAYGELAVFGWNKHVAPVVTVRTGTGDLVELVLDPSISTGPSPISLWLGRMGVAECTFFRPDHPLVSRADTPDPSCLYTVNDRSEWQLWNDELARKNLEALARYRAMPVVPRP